MMHENWSIPPNEKMTFGERGRRIKRKVIKTLNRFQTLFCIRDKTVAEIAKAEDESSKNIDPINQFAVTMISAEPTDWINILTSLNDDESVDLDKTIVAPEKTTHEKVPFGYLQIVTKLDQEQVEDDDSFPRIEGSLEPLSTKYAVQVADSSTTKITDNLSHHRMMIATPRSGRQLNELLDAEIIYGGRAISTIMIKGTGVPNIVRETWVDYAGQDDPFFFTEKQTGGETATGLIAKNEMMGPALKEDQVEDARNSLVLHNAGVKVRIPLGGWEVKSFVIAGEQKDIAWFKEHGYDGEVLYQSAWGMTCPLRIEDINDMLSEAVYVNNNPKLLDDLLKELLVFAQKDKSKPYVDLSKKWKDILDLDNFELDEDTRVQLWTDFGIALCETMGSNFDSMHKANLKHGNAHDQNISFFGELCDNSTVSEGLLVSGGDQKIGDDIDSFADGMRRFNDRVLAMSGVNTFDEFELVQEALDKYKQAVRKNWISYEEWVKTSTGLLVSDNDNRNRAENELNEYQNEVDEYDISRQILRKTGGERRFRIYGED
ncbi:MAG: hypothetical protein H6772_02410 [Pseudomonadales bacterium]|nr:hypothetical protein [Pseudomonadales bacterium]